MVIVVLLISISNAVYCEQFLAATNETNYTEQLMCTANCLQQLNKIRGRVPSSMQTCIRECTYNADDYILKPSSANISLLCRDHESLTVKFDDYFESNDAVTINNIFVIELGDDNDTDKSKVLFTSYLPIITLNGLDAGTGYDVWGTVIQSQVNRTFGDDNEIDKKISTQTLSVNHELGNVTDVHVLKYFPIAHNKFNVMVSWTPPPDLPCNYSIRWRPIAGDHQSDQQHWEFHQSDQYLVTDLHFGAIYELSITTMSNTRPPAEGHIRWYAINIPTCLEWYNNDIYYCAPNEPENIQVVEFITAKHQYDLNVSWNKPVVRPASYLIQIHDLKDENEATQYLNGDAINVYMENVVITSLIYDISLTAFSPGGSTTTRSYFNLTQIYDNEIDANRTLRQTLYISLPAAFVMIVAIAMAIYINRRNIIRQMQEKFRKDLDYRGEPHIDENQNDMDVIRKEFPIDRNDRMEVDPSQVETYEKIGEGAFGFVRRGLLRPAGIAVAVKTLKNSSSIDERREFMREIFVMKSVGHHPNIVGIIGHSTKDHKNMMLLTEYCSDGNLLDFLRNIWKQVNKVQQPNVGDSGTPVISDTGTTDSLCFTPAVLASKSPELAFNFNTSFTDKYPIEHKAIMDDRYLPVLSTITPRVDLAVNMAYETVLSEFAATAAGDIRLRYVENPAYNESVVNIQNEDDPTADVVEVAKVDAADEPIVDTFAYHRRQTIEVSYMDLLQFAKQIAQGMAFLSRNRIVHRDLAARNVLVGSDKKVKISDFGMSRDIYQLNVYLRSGDGKLPIKWLAIESMTHQLYTSQSDVWSYGVLLYEIMTLGSQPYPAIDAAELPKLLKIGYRMDRPRNCNDAIYELMMMCWRTDPNERPKFADIVQKVDRFIVTADEK